MTKPTGKLIVIGGAEDKGDTVEFPEPSLIPSLVKGPSILKRFVQECGGKNSSIEVITTASEIPVEVAAVYQSAFSLLGCSSVKVMHIESRRDAMRPEVLDRIASCNGVYFTGGNQLRLTTIFGGTKFLEILQQRYQHDALVIAGTSAGAMVMSSCMIYEGASELGYMKGAVKTVAGFGLLGDVIIDTHFDKRGRFMRLAQTVGSNPSCLGIGIGEDTGIVISGGDDLEIIGGGSVVIIDGRKMMHNNISSIAEGDTISMEQLIVHFAEAGNGYKLSGRKFFADHILGKMALTK